MFSLATLETKFHVPHKAWFPLYFDTYFDTNPIQVWAGKKALLPVFPL